MARKFTFRLDQEGVDQLRKELEALGQKGDEAFKRLAQSSPQLLDALRRAEEQAGKTRAKIEDLDKGAPVLKALAAGADEATSRFNTFAGQVPVVGTALKALGPAGTVFASTIGLATTLLFKGAAAVSEFDKGVKRLESVLRATGQASGLTARQIADFAEQMESATTATKDGVVESATALATFRSVSGDAFFRTIRLAQDLSSVFGGDLRSATVTLGKALEDPVDGLTSLRRVGITFTDAQKEQIKTLVESGEKFQAQQMILESLTRQIGGAGGTVSVVKDLRNEWNNYLEDVARGNPVIDAKNAAIRGLTDALKWLRKESSDQSELERLDSLLSNRKGADPRGDAFIFGGAERRRNEILGTMRGAARDAEDARQGAEMSGAAAQSAREDDRLAERKRLLDELAAAQDRLTEINRQGAKEREKEAAADEAVAKAKEKVGKLSADEEKAIRARAVAGIEAKQAADAQADAEKKLQAATEAVTKAEQKRIEQQLEALDKVDLQVEGIRRETEVLGVDESGRRVLAEVMQAENTLRAEGIDLMDEEAQARLAAVRAAAEEREAKRKIVDAQKDAMAEAKRNAERATDSITRYIGDKFADVFSKTKGGWKAVWQDAVTTAKAAMLRIAAEAVIRPVVAPIVGNMFGVSGGSGGGLPFVSGGGGGGGTDLFGLARSGLSLGNNTGLFGDTFSGIGSSITSGLDTFGASLGFSSVNGGANTLYGLAGVESGAIDAGFIAGEGALSGASLSSVLGGAGAGFAAGTLLNSLVGGKETGGMVGSAVGAIGGAIIGSIIPGIGTLIGGLIGGSGGGLIGGLFGPGPGFSGATGKVGIDAQGRAFNSGAVGKRYDLGQAGSATDQFVQTINTAMAALGLKFGAQATSYFTGLGFGGGSVPIERNVTSLLGYGDVKSGDSALDAKIKSYFAKEYDTPSGESADALLQSLTEIVGLHKLFTDNPNPLVPEKLTAVDQAIKDIGSAFDELKPKIEKYGYSLVQLEELRVKALDKIRTGFNESIQDQILAFSDPRDLALRQLTRLQEERLKEAKAAGADLVEVEKLAGLERERVLRESNDNIKAVLQDLTGSTNSPLPLTQLLASAEGRFNDARSRALGGESGARDDLAAAARDLIDFSRAAFASGPQFFERFNFVVTTLQNIVGGAGFAEGTESASAGWHWVGERGPELRRFRGGEQVMPTNAVRRLAAAPDGDVELLRAVLRLGQQVETMSARLDRSLRVHERNEDTLTRLAVNAKKVA